jgi:hypothetical protein
MLLVLGLSETGSRLRASVSGTASVSVEYVADVRQADGSGSYSFNVSIEPLMFRLQSVQGKYRLLRLRVQNSTAATIAFSSDADRFDVITRGATVPAVLNPQHVDAPFWDALDATTRETLAYPMSLKGVAPAAPGARPASPESIYIYLLVPASQVSQVPDSFTYSIKSLNQVITIRTRPPMAR